MSVIAALHENDETWFGSDSMANYDGTWIECGSKFVRVGPYAVGCTGDSRLHTLLRIFRGTLAGHMKEGGDVLLLIEAIRDLLKQDEFKPVDEPGPQNFSQNLLIAAPEGIYSVCSAFSVDPMPTGILMADGAGMRAARAADLSLIKTGFMRDPEHRLKNAIEVAIKLESNCNGEPLVEKL